MDTGKILLGVLAGAAAGAAIGILFAPDKGANTRKKIFDKGDEYLDDLKLKFDEFLETMTQKYESVKEDADDLLEKEKTMVQQVKSDVKNAVNEKVSH